MHFKCKNKALKMEIKGREKERTEESKAHCAHTHIEMQRKHENAE